MLIKLRANVPEIILGALLAIAIFAMGMLFDSSRHQPTNQPASPASQQIQTAHDPDPFTWDWLTHDGVVFFTFVLTFVAGIQAFLFVQQLKLIQRTLSSAEEAATAARDSADALTSAERPHLLISKLNARIALDLVASLDDEVVPITYTFEIRNYGRSPAFIGNYIFQFHCGQLPAYPKYDELWCDNKNIVVPNRWFRSLQELKIADIPVGEVSQINAGELPVYIFGVLEYKGIFKGKTHKLRFCYKMIFVKEASHSVLFLPDGPASYWDYA